MVIYKIRKFLWYFNPLKNLYEVGEEDKNFKLDFIDKSKAFSKYSFLNVMWHLGRDISMYVDLSEHIKGLTDEIEIVTVFGDRDWKNHQIFLDETNVEKAMEIFGLKPYIIYEVEVNEREYFAGQR